MFPDRNVRMWMAAILAAFAIVYFPPRLMHSMYWMIGEILTVINFGILILFWRFLLMNTADLQAIINWIKNNFKDVK